MTFAICSQVNNCFFHDFHFLCSSTKTTGAIMAKTRGSMASKKTRLLITGSRAERSVRVVTIQQHSLNRYYKINTMVVEVKVSLNPHIIGTCCKAVNFSTTGGNGCVYRVG